MSEKKLADNGTADRGKLQKGQALKCRYQRELKHERNNPQLIPETIHMQSYFV